MFVINYPSLLYRNESFQFSKIQIRHKQKYPKIQKKKKTKYFLKKGEKKGNKEEKEEKKETKDKNKTEKKKHHTNIK